MLTTELDRASQIIQWAAYCTAILGNPKTGDFELIEVSDAKLPEERFSEFSARGLYCIGVFGVGQGGTRAALDEPLEEAVVSNLCAKFLRMYLSKRMEDIVSAAPQLKDAGAAWLQRMFELPDPRTAN